MKSKKYILILLGAIILISNISPFDKFFALILDEKHYRYANFDGSYTFIEFKSRDFNHMKRIHQACLDLHPNQKDKKVYRLFWKNPFAFWRWKLYFFDERYSLPYKNWNDIEKIRNKGAVEKCYQEF